MKKRFTDYPDFIKCAWTGFEAMRRLGFSADDIFFLAPGELSLTREVFILLKTQEKTFSMGCGPTELNEETICQLWQEFGNRISGKLSKEDEDDLHAIWESSACYHMGHELIRVLRDKGFMIPMAVN